MKPMVFAVAGVLATIGSAMGQAAAPPDKDLAAFANGALIDHASSIYGDDWAPIWLLDEDAATGWATVQGARAPFEIVIDLPEQSEIHALEFDTAGVEKPERSAGNIDVLISDQSATAGFQPLTSVTLKAADNQVFKVATPGKGRWLKLLVKSNLGDPDYTEIMNVRALGTELTQTPLPNVSGTYSSETFGNFHLSQDGAQLSGCYEHDSGLVQGGLEAHLMRLTWTEGDKGEKHGPALMVLKPDGKSFRGFWQYDGDTGWHADWDLHKISDRVGSCPNWSPKGKSGNLVATGLADAGRVRLYGINFDSDRDSLRQDAAPTLAELKQALAANPAWQVTVEGYTDSTSTPAHNLDLSQRRAEAVKAYLVKAGIAAARIAAKGLGEGDPVASNDTEIGRAQNRRVEIVRE